MEKKIQNLIDKFNASDDISKQVDYAIKLSSHYRSISKFDLSNSYIEKALERAKKGKNQLAIAKLFKEISLIHYSKLKIDEALDFSFQALAIYKSLVNKKESSDILCNIGVYYNVLNLPKRAKDYFYQSLKYNPENFASLNNIGEYYAAQGKHEKAINFFLEIISNSKSPYMKEDLAYSLKSLGEVYIDLDKNEKARDYLDQALQKLGTTKNSNLKALILLGLSSTYLNTNQAEKALLHSLKALGIAKELNNNEIYWFCYNKLAKIHEALEDYKQANRYLNLSLKMHEYIYSGKITNRVAKLEATYKIEMKKLQSKQLIEKNARLASIGVMTAGITHEINQPLNSIVINADGIIFKDNRDKVLPESYRQSVEKIFTSAQRIDQIIRHMRSYWNSGEEYIKNENLFINSCIDNALSLINQQIRSHGIELEKKFTLENPMIIGNNVHLEQIIINLITNAINSLDKSTKKQKTIKVITKLKADLVIIKIEDNGIGFSLKDEQHNIFDPFYSTKMNKNSMGLGLAIVNNYISQMNGKISYSNLDEGGVIFTIKFPILENSK